MTCLKCKQEDNVMLLLRLYKLMSRHSDATIDFKKYQYKRQPSQAKQKQISQSPRSKGKTIKAINQDLHLIQLMRKRRDAPVDTMGCHKTADGQADPDTKAFQTLVGVLLSVQTTDQITFLVTQKLNKAGLSLEWARKTSLDDIKALIKSVNFHKKKAQSIKLIANLIHDKYNAKVPDQYDSLIKLPGIGPKIAHVFLRAAFGANSGIGVDVHVHRIVNRLDWVHTSQPNETEKALQSLFQKQQWNTLNLLLVGFGQQICRAKPKCSQCKLRTSCTFEYKEMF